MKRLPTPAEVKVNCLIFIAVLCAMCGIVYYGKNPSPPESVEQQYLNLGSYEQSKEKFKDLLLNSEDPEQVDSAYNEFVDDVQSNFALMEGVKSGKEKLFYSILRTFIEETAQKNIQLNDVMIAVQSPRILDYSILKREGEFEFQIGVVSDYIKKATENNEYTFNAIVNLQEKLKALGEDSQIYKNSVSAISETFAKQKPVLELLGQAQIDYGNHLLGILENLKNNKKVWLYENDMLVINDDGVLTKHNQLFNFLEEDE
ncbi:hypothetical protein H0A36_09705 [Endozoicomonas sp. SM1973]|uniref:Uncharacterized protein n=1 Tax=Spartinivicinus marinus TaxID=2994442 RepID=A0A853IFK0_9GAMM|nr:hypothetical protein [Spartinivicinus marinus]MCX4024687.1 hypothetical protein [Spartinivicinus marinus]NYZ66286.1 hypothetical protein [Spartinivicinus marinus]